MNEELLQTFEALTVILEDQESFDKVLSGVTEALDPEKSGQLQLSKIKDFMSGTSLKMDDKTFEEVFSELNEEGEFVS